MKNRGSTFLLVIMAFAVAGILSGLVLTLSYSSFKTGLKSGENLAAFYGADSVLEEIRAGLAHELYLERQNSSDPQNALISRLSSDGSHTGYDIDVLAGLTGNDAVTSGSTDIISKEEYDNIKEFPYITIDSPDRAMDIDEENKKIVLKDIMVRFVNEKRGVSRISTDIVIECDKYKKVSDCVYYENWQRRNR